MNANDYVIIGIGICMDEIKDRIDNRKMVEYLIEQLPDMAEELRKILNSEELLAAFDIEDYMQSTPYYYVAEIFASLDDSHWLCYDDASGGTEYLYFRPVYPWQIDDACPRSIDEVHQLLISVISQLTDMTAEEIEAVIDDDLSDWYFG